MIELERLIIIILALALVFALAGWKAGLIITCIAVGTFILFIIGIVLLFWFEAKDDKKRGRY
jgi:hypothetical protein